MPDLGVAPARFDLRQFWHSVVERLWIVVLCILAGLFLALGYLARTPKLYQSHSVLEVDVQEPTLVSEDAPMRMRSMFLASQEAMRTIEQNLTNRALLGRVVRAEHFADDGGRALVGRDITGNESKATPRPSGAGTAVGGEAALTPIEDALGGAMTRMVKPVIRRGTRLIDLFITHTDPVIAQRIADAIGREYIRSAVERRASSTQESLRYLL